MANNSNGLNTIFGGYAASGMAGMISDYNTIKNGSYGKLMKAYYQKMDREAGVGSSRTKGKDVLSQILNEKKNPTVSKEVKEANTGLSDGISKVKSSVSTLQLDSTYENPQDSKTKDKVAAAVKDFVSNYNNMVSCSKKSTNTEQTRSVAEMMKTTSANADKLAEIGVTVNKDGTLGLSEKTLKATDVSKVQELFSPDNRMSYGSRISGRALTAGYSSGDTSAKVSAVDAERIDKASSDAAGLKKDAQDLKAGTVFEKKKDADGEETDEYDISAITSKVSSFIKNYNEAIDSASKLTNSGVASNLGNLMDKTKKSSGTMSGFGIKVGANGKLSMDEETFKKADMAKVKNFFKDYASSIATSASLVNYYSSTQAGSSSTYKSTGAYMAEALSSFTGTV